ncbi:S-layer homology domain-containing protein [Paenibacillus sp. USHLN196]|uniref:S-layer homology domain-containing protein n=1 Tax=Paenibacillus sp. USHLN196 TaxID=3081291 RepID=UPI003017D84D
MLLSRVSSNESKEGIAFPSSVLGRWSEEEVTDAIAKGFVSSNEIVDPQEKITRIQMVRWMVNGLSETSSSYAEATMDTVVPVAEYYKGGLNKKDYSDVSVALGTGLMTGFTNGSFDPDQTTTHARKCKCI